MLNNILFGMVIVVMLIAVFNNVDSHRTPMEPDLPYPQFINAVKTGQVQQVFIDGPVIKVKTNTGETFTTYNPNGDPSQMVEDLLSSGVEVKTHAQETPCKQKRYSCN